jgi:hypothetical protein
MFGFLKKNASPKEAPQFPPVPAWKPSIVQPINNVVERSSFYTNGSRDFAVFTNGTVSILPDGLSNSQADAFAKQALHKVFHAHVDMQPLQMRDGNILIQYNHDVANIVLNEIVDQNWSEIEKNHLQALATHEVLITPLGPNVFDDFGKRALFGRCFMFMDAQQPQVIEIERKLNKT